ncbi:MAG: septum formation protein Maf [Myxococcales bacterium]|nr:MAG: septum formation protein Maf [Myxococcales bacterium]
MATFLLGSASPRRREILRTLGLRFEVAAVDADESERPGEAPDAYLTRVVAAKLALAADRARALGLDAVVVADTTVVLDGRMLAKPVDRADNRSMIAALAGREHEVMTRFAVRGPAGEVARTVTTRVSFRPLTDTEIDGYAASGEGLDKAGGYAIQGLGSFMVEAIAGSYSCVVGLPACEVAQALVAAGVIAGLPVQPER